MGATDGLFPDAVAALYGIPLDRDGAGQSIGIIAGGGGYWPSDLQIAAPGRPALDIREVSVGGTQNNAGSDPVKDAELALDLQIVAALVPAATITIYFTTGNQEGLVRALEYATGDSINRPSVLSISWGSEERYWQRTIADSAGAQQPAIEVMEAALALARDRGISVVAAAGDDLATNRVLARRASVLYPASSPLVLGCGGTQIKLSPDAGAILEETVWNETLDGTGSSGTGGGISDVFDVPDYQSRLALPASFRDHGRRRGVPDVAAVAAEQPGYRIVIDGETVAKGGTSAATPLWAALIVMANAARGRSLGLINPYLYANPAMFRPVLEGNNTVNGIGFWAGPDWNACTGLGVPIGARVIETLAAV